MARVRKLQETSRAKRARYMGPRPLASVDDDGQRAFDFPEDRRWWTK